jgi:tRNA (guanine37-N1)-methyltransferase
VEAKLKILVYTLFPDAVNAVFGASILRRAQVKGLVSLEARNLRDFTTDKHKTTDDTPFGGKQGMLIKPDVASRAAEAELERLGGDRSRLKVVATNPRGARLEQPIAERFAQWLAQGEGNADLTAGEAERSLVIFCGRYEGIDERFYEEWVDLELSLGDFILSGGELAALPFVDAVVRLIPGVLGNVDSNMEDSFSNGLIEYPQYTKPREHHGRGVPEELTNGNHAVAERWRLRQSLLTTAAFRPDLILAHAGENLAPWAQDLLAILKKRIDSRS